MQNLDKPYQLLHLLGIVYRWRRQLMYFVGGVVVFTALVSLFIPNYYEASTTFVPANEDKPLFGEGKNNSLYGDDDAIDRALILARSGPLVDFMIAEFKLDERYAIDASTPKGQEKVTRRFLKLYNVKKNQYSGITIKIEDTSPEVAKDMVDKLLYKLETLLKEATKPNKDLLTKTYETALATKRAEIQAALDTLANLRQRFGIYDPNRQAELLSELLVQSESQLVSDRAKLGYYQRAGGRGDSVNIVSARIAGNEERLRLLLGQAKEGEARSSINTGLFNQGADLVQYNQRRLQSLNSELSDLVEKYDQFKAQAASQASSIIVLEPVQIPKIKSYPPRSIFVALAGLLALFLGLCAAILLDVYRKTDWSKLITEKEEDGDPTQQTST